MGFDQGPAAQRLAAWTTGLEAELPAWEELPELELYMDQVILLLTKYLQPVCQSGEEKAITASIINNYVRLKLLPPPVKKKYSRVHLAYLMIICTLKQSLSISCIQRLLPEEQEADAVRQLYEDFSMQYRSAVRFIRRASAGEGGLLPEGGGSLAVGAAILSTLAKGLTEALLRDEPQKA